MSKDFNKKLKKSFQSITFSAPVQWVVALLMAVCIWLVYFTCVRKINGKKRFKEYSKKSAIFVFWHGRTMMLAPMVITIGVRGYAIASRHRDGRFMARLLRLFGLRAIYGSTSTGGVSVLRHGVKILKENRYAICMSPDGPSGPSLRLHDGAIAFAQMSNVPIIPVCFTASRPWIQNRWDKYLVAKPFSKLVFDVGAPIYIDRKLTASQFEKTKTAIESLMIKQQRDLDKQFGLPIIPQDLTASEYKKILRDAKAKK